ncbi:hypothetical protein TeGR_g11459 [Tetraparma gracilis]|uniref:Ribosome biogenesis protein NOP53 n=1 Tax=Tetraparma gracilis TaxID=2962635 RepID=A0ABQ6M574_9STRA|nr:hypothetical protein TeGR_g11459 [Tetraparma gracilis]
MPRKGSASSRAIRASRASETASAAASLDAPLSAAPDSALFQLDVSGSSSKRARAAPAEEQAFVPKPDRRVDRLVRTHGKRALEKLAGDARKKLPGSFNGATKAKKLRRATAAAPSADLWDDSASAPAGAALTSRGGRMPGTTVDHVLRPELLKRTSGSRHKKAVKALEWKERNRTAVDVDVAHQGQSYNPDGEAHQEMLGVAVAAEYKRKEKQKFDKTPLQDQGMSEETLAVLDMESDDGSSSEEEEEENAERVGAVVKRTKKLTKADRNKARRHREKELEARKRKQDKKLMAELLDSKKHKKTLAKEAREKGEKLTEKKRLLDEKEREPKGVRLEEEEARRDPKRARTIAVALSDEVGGGLRKVVKKGDMLKERQLALAAGGKLQMKSTAERKKTEGKKRRNLMKRMDKFIF